MRFHTYTKFSPELADAVDLQALLDKLADFLLQSGFAGGGEHSYYDSGLEDPADRSLEALKKAILQALLDGGQFTPEMLEALRGEDKSEGEGESKLAGLLDQLIQRLVSEGYMTVDAPPQMPAGYQPLTGPGSISKAAARDINFNMTEKGVDFLGFKSLRNLLGSLGKSSFGSHDTPHLATGVEADGWSKQYEFGDVLNLDVNETLKRSLARTGSIGVPLDLDYDDLMVRQAEYRSSCATVLMLDCSHSMILYGEDRFTVGHVGDRASRSLPHQYRRRAEARSAVVNGAEQGHAPDHHDHRWKAERDDTAQWPDLQELLRPRRHRHRADAARSCRVPPERSDDQHLHARP